MKFNVFKIHEIIYKKVLYFIIFLVTIACIIFYLQNQSSDEIPYILSIFYALFLFIVGLYINVMTTQTQNMFLKRKEQYRSLKALSTIYKPNMEEKNNLFSFIFLVKGFTGTLDPNVKPWTTISGYEFKNNYLYFVDWYIDEKPNLASIIQNEVKSYIEENNLKMKNLNVFINDAEKFFDDIHGWIKGNLELTTEERIAFHSFTKELKQRNRQRFNKFNKVQKKINKMNKKIGNKCKNNIELIEEIYGDRLFESIKEEDELYYKFDSLEKTINELKYEILDKEDYIDISNEQHDSIVKHLESIDGKLIQVKDEVERVSFLLDD